MRSQYYAKMHLWNCFKSRRQFGIWSKIRASYSFRAEEQVLVQFNLMLKLPLTKKSVLPLCAILVTGFDAFCHIPAHFETLNVTKFCVIGTTIPHGWGKSHNQICLYSRLTFQRVNRLPKRDIWHLTGSKDQTISALLTGRKWRNMSKLRTCQCPGC